MSEDLLPAERKRDQDRLASMLRSLSRASRTATPRSVAGLQVSALGGHDPHGHPLDAVHEVGADPLGRSGELDRRDPG